MIEVMCLDNGQRLWFDANTPLRAMQRLIYYLDCSHKDKNAQVMLVGGGRVLTVIHNGKTWSTRNPSNNQHHQK